MEQILMPLFGALAIGAAVYAVYNGNIACGFPDSMVEQAKPYFKKSYVSLGCMLLFIAIAICFTGR